VLLKESKEINATVNQMLDISGALKAWTKTQAMTTSNSDPIN